MNSHFWSWIALSSLGTVLMVYLAMLGLLKAILSGNSLWILLSMASFLGYLFCYLDLLEFQSVKETEIGFLLFFLSMVGSGIFFARQFKRKYTTSNKKPTSRSTHGIV